MLYISGETESDITRCLRYILMAQPISTILILGLEVQILLASLSVKLSLFKVEPGLVIDSLVLSGYC